MAEDNFTDHFENPLFHWHYGFIFRCNYGNFRIVLIFVLTPKKDPKDFLNR